MPKGYPYKIQVKVPTSELKAGWTDGGPGFQAWMKENIGKPYHRWSAVPVTIGVNQPYALIEVCFCESKDAVLTALRWS